MRYIVSFGRFWYDFLVGDDWTIALAVVLAVCAVAALSHAGGPVWLILPIAVGGILSASIWRAASAARNRH